MEKLERIKTKILSREQIKNQCNIWRFNEKKIVFTNGCFDILHLGHIEYLIQAADLGGILLIGLNSDVSVKAIKGSDRPFNSEESRAIILASLSFVDGLIIFDEETPYELIKLVKPDILVKGADYSVDQIAGHDIVQAHGGEVVTIPLTEGYSTTDLIARIKR
ncbi:MAG: D-glycero-beta-D-manno-heptose 1-phosphate adenylyltransferase [Bacteroidales bacterium]|nr:D-glycero-beta-D-manno-heptose 1-phosphate adenylyltransferase [Bacteroidota bacterium]MBL6949611.1 D-glycero-beta-D-manno-heptose 1-phosphate adenylyltransferase [Bacteroidales bacterium]